MAGSTVVEPVREPHEPHVLAGLLARALRLKCGVERAARSRRARPACRARRRARRADRRRPAAAPAMKRSPCSALISARLVHGSACPVCAMIDGPGEHRAGVEARWSRRSAAGTAASGARLTLADRGAAASVASRADAPTSACPRSCGRISSRAARPASRTRVERLLLGLVAQQRHRADRDDRRRSEREPAEHETPASRPSVIGRGAQQPGPRDHVVDHR